MEACTMKPEVKKKPKSIKRNEPDPPPPAVPQRPTDAELSHTQYRLNKMTATNNEGKESVQTKASASNESLFENNNTKEKGSIFKKSPEGSRLEEGAEMLQGNLSASTDSLSESKEKGGLFSGLLRKTLKAPGEFQGKEAQKELLTSNDDLSDYNITKEKNFLDRNQQKPAESAAAQMGSEVNTEDQLSASCENLNGSTVMKETNAAEEQKLSASDANLLEANTAKGKTRELAGLFKRSPKPSPRSIATQDPLSSQLSDSWDSLTDAGKEDVLAKLSANNDNLSEASSTPKEGEDIKGPEGGGLRCKTAIKKKRKVVSFRVKKTLPKIPQVCLSSQSSEKMPVTEDTFEMQQMSRAQVSTVVVQPVEMAAYPSEENPPETEPEEDELMEWWNTVKGWKEWNETSDFQEEDEEMAMEQAADRVYMAASLFVRLFNQRGGSLQQRILELLAMADAADEFHKKTVSAAVGGGVASVAGSITTITGLILAPFTFGASIIVTAVGIGVATAGSITSATANITDTVHSNMDSKKVEKIIQGYQEEISDIRECLKFVQEGIDTLQEWDLEKYAQSAAKKALNHNLKHVMREGGRAGKALMINTDKLISTVQVLGAAGGVAKAAKAISVTTGVISALFLALDVFFLARDSHELHKGAKTKFASKIREVCKDLQSGLLELNKVKTQLQKTMDGIEVEEFEEVEEVEDDSDPKKLAELEQELDLLEEKVDKKVENVQKKGKEIEKENSGESVKAKDEEKKEKSIKKQDEKEKKKDKEKKEDNDIKDKEESKLEKELEKVKSTSEGNKSEKVKIEREKNTERRRSEKDKEHEHTHQGHRARANAFLGDGLNI